MGRESWERGCQSWRDFFPNEFGKGNAQKCKTIKRAKKKSGMKWQALLTKMSYLIKL